MVEQNAEYGWLTGGEATRLKHIRERLAAYRPDPTSPSTNRAVDDMRFTADLANRLARELADQRATEAVLRGEIRP